MPIPTKKCCTCHRDLPITQFNVRRAAKDGLQSRCRECSAQWYEVNKESHQRNVAARNAAVRAEYNKRIIAYLRDHPCVDCGESDLRVLDFDHRDPTLKEDVIGRLLQRRFRWELIAAEIAKCDVRCANCHRKRTAEMFGWGRHVAQMDVREVECAAVLARLQRLVKPSVLEPSPPPVTPRAEIAPGVWQLTTPARVA